MKRVADGLLAKRTFDALAAALGLTLVAPLLLGIAIAVKLDSRGPALYHQLRVGRGGRTFRLHKFRTMVPGADRSSRITPGNDPRITRLGAFLRRTNLDELPQLWNVLVGDMSLVGPRPEVPEFVDLADPLWRQALLVRPGMTSPETLTLRREGEILATFTDPEKGYREVVLPAKLAQAAAYAEKRTFGGDLRVILATLGSIVRGRAG